MFCHLQIHFSYTSDGIPSHLVVHPTLLSTPFLDISSSLPLPVGTPITLLPFGTPAYFLACYSGPTTGLTKQFHLVLQGLGAGDWDNLSASSFRSSAFVIGWISVENKQGEDKGLTIIYPAKLCLTCPPLDSSRRSLDCIPDLPAPLQPSPQASRLRSSSKSGLSASTSIHPPRSSFPTSESFNSFRAVTLSSNDLEQVTAEVGEYIDAVARERERERERLRREREIGTASSPKNLIPSMTPVMMPTNPIEQSIFSPSTLSSVPQFDSLPLSSSGLGSQQPRPSSAAIQAFYPSPPQCIPPLVPPTESKMTPEAGDSAKVIHVSSEEPLKSEGTSFESYDLNSTWSRPKDDYLMDFVMNDIGLDFNLGMANTSSTGATMTSFNERDGPTTATRGIDFEDAFTDDDFSFFDQPSRPKLPPWQSPTLPRRSFDSRMTPLNLGDLPGLDITQSSPHLFTPDGFVDDFTPHSLINPEPHGLIPSSSGPTPENQSVPSTPTVYLELESSSKRPVIFAEGLLNASTGLFEPIPFAASHREADDKYTVGKFALPSPPSEAGSTSVSLPASPSRFGVSGGCKFTYDAVTDPRIGLVKKLIGVKRKILSVGSESSPSKKTFWAIGQGDWDRGEEMTRENGESDAEDGDDVEESDNTTPSRPTTPPPSYLPLGPTLLSAHFQHSHLLSRSIPLRSPGAAIRPLNLTSTNNPTPSFPTPVSPAAIMEAASEKSRSLEAAASTVAVEVVENPLWAESWKATLTGVSNMGGVWSTDIKAVQKLLESIPGLEAPLTLARLFGLTDIMSDRKDIASGYNSTLQPMETPMISIGKGEAVIHVLPPALRFWEKLGLSPKGGRKNFAAFVMFEENAQQQPFMEKWLVSFRTTYQVRSLIPPFA